LYLFKTHFKILKKEERENRVLYTWEDTRYQSFMISLLQNLEPRFCLPGDYIFTEFEEVNEQIYVTEGLYAVGLTLN